MSKSHAGRRGLAALATSALVVGACVAGAGAASADSNFSFTRVYGGPNSSRYDTAVEVAKQFGNSDNVILASGEANHYPDALSANYLAGHVHEPILLTQRDATPTNVLAYLKSSNVKTITIVGGPLAVSQAQEDALKAQGYTVNRLSGGTTGTRFDTNAAILKAAGNAASTASNTALIATGNNFPDALGAGPLAYHAGMPVGLSNKGDIADEVIAALKADQVDHAIILGGPLAVPQSVIDKLEANGIKFVTRLQGSAGNTGRSGTAAAVADYAVKNLGFSVNHADVASGRVAGDGADALAAGPLSGKEDTPLLITETESKAGAADSYLKAHANTLQNGRMYGGPLAITDALKAELEKAAQSVTSNQTYSVTPQDKATLGATNDSKSERTYTVSGLDDSKTYNLALFEAKNVDTTSGQVKFADNEDANNDGTKEGNDVADQGSPDANITSVNNGSAVTVTNTTVKPVNGTVKFTINSAAPDDVVPVIWLDSTTGKTGLDLNADNTPSEKFAVGGETVYTPQAAPNGSTGTWTVVSNDEAANTFVGSTGATSTQRTFSYDSNDVYTENGHQVTMDAFEKALSTDDQVTPTYYYTDSSLVTTWALNDRAPGAPTGVTVAKTKGSESTSLTVSWTAPSLGSPDTYNVYRLKSDATTSNFPDDYTKVGSVNGDTTKYVDSGLTKSTTYKYVVTAVDQGDESDASTAQTGTTAANNATDQTAPVAQETAVTTSGGLGTVLDAGDVVKIGFDEKVAAPANGDRIRVQDTNTTPTVADLVNGSNATFSLNTAPEQIDGGVARPAGTVLTITLTGDPSVVTAGTNGGVQYPATIVDQAGLTDAAGNVWKPGATGQDVEILAPGQENWSPLNAGTTYNGQTLTMDDRGITGGTSYENQNLQVPVKAGDEISFEYKLGTGANCTQGSPRVFIRGGSYHTADNTNLSGVCGTQIGTSDWYKVTYTVPSGATAGDAGYTGVVNDNSNGVVQVRNVMIAGQQVL